MYLANSMTSRADSEDGIAPLTPPRHRGSRLSPKTVTSAKGHDHISTAATSTRSLSPNGSDSSTMSKRAFHVNGLDPHTIAMGALRVNSDLRQTGAFLVILGIGASHSALALKSTLIDGMEGSNQVEGFKLPALVAVILQTILGLASMAVGFVALVVSPLSQSFHVISKILVLVINLGPISFFISIVRLAQGASQPPEDNDFIPPAMDPTETDIRFVVAMGILSLVSVCSTLIGGLTIVALNLCAYLGKQPIDKNKGYYLFRYAYYNLLVVLGGLSALLLGVYLNVRFGPGPYDEAVHVAVYTVFFPALTIFVGAVQTLVGLYGWCRAVGWGVKMGVPDDNRFLWACFFMWLVTMSVQIIAQPAYAQADAFQGEPSTVSAVYMGTFIMPPYLDYLVRHTPVKIAPEYFGLPPDTKERPDALARLFGLTSEQQLKKKAAETPHSTSSTVLHSPSDEVNQEMEL